MSTPRFTFPKEEKLKSKKLIGRLFSEGNSVSSFPIRLVYVETSFQEELKAQAGFSVPKRNFKLAVSRNRIKRLLREAYRHQKPALFNNITTPYAFMFLYLGKKEPSAKEISDKMEQLLIRFLEKTSAEK